MTAVLHRALVLCAALVSCTVAAGPPPVSDFPKRLVAGTPDSSALDPPGSSLVRSHNVVVDPTIQGIGSRSATTSLADLNQANVASSKGTQLPGSSDGLSSALKAKVVASIASVPGHLATFVENKGQWDARARLRLSNGGKAIWLTDAGIVFDVQRAKEAKAAITQTAAAAEPSTSAEQHRAVPRRLPQGTAGPTLFQHAGVPARESIEYERLVFSEEFVGANGSPSLEPIDPQPGIYNYLIGSDRSRWHTDVHGYGGVTYRSVWENVDFKLVANGTNIEQEFIVRPGGDPASVQVAYRGTDGLAIADDGSLVVRTRFGELRETKPRIYQEIAGQRVPVDGRFKLTSNSTFTFEVKATGLV